MTLGMKQRRRRTKMMFGVKKSQVYGALGASAHIDPHRRYHPLLVGQRGLRCRFPYAPSVVFSSVALGSYFSTACLH